MNSWWTAWRVILVTVCGCAVVTTLGSVVTDALASASAEKTKRLRDSEDNRIEIARAEARIAEAKAAEARYKAEEAATKAACDDCANFASREEVQKLQEVG